MQANLVNGRCVHAFLVFSRNILYCVRRARIVHPHRQVRTSDSEPYRARGEVFDETASRRYTRKLELNCARCETEWPVAGIFHLHIQSGVDLMWTSKMRRNCNHRKRKWTVVVHPRRSIPGRDVAGAKREGLYKDTEGGSRPRVKSVIGSTSRQCSTVESRFVQVRYSSRQVHLQQVQQFTRLERISANMRLRSALQVRAGSSVCTGYSRRPHTTGFWRRHF